MGIGSSALGRGAVIVALLASACGSPAPPPAPQRDAAAPVAEPPAADPPRPLRKPEDRPGAPDQWEEARTRGIDFRAVGQEPGWYVEIDHEGSMRLLYDYAEREAVLPAPLPLVTGGQTTYAAASRQHTLSVISEARVCADSMSGAEYPRTVTVTIDGRRLQGCGMELR